MSNLKPLVWSVNEIAATINITAESPLHNYTIYPDEHEGGYVIYYFERMTGESGRAYKNTVDEAQEWAQSTHYPSKMQPYVKPLLTWIDVNERLPDDDGKYLVATSCGKQWMGNYNLPPKPNEWMLNGWSMNGGWHPFDISHWMPIPEFSTMQNNKGE